MACLSADCACPSLAACRQQLPACCSYVAALKLTQCHHMHRQQMLPNVSCPASVIHFGPLQQQMSFSGIHILGANGGNGMCRVKLRMTGPLRRTWTRNCSAATRRRTRQLREAAPRLLHPSMSNAMSGELFPLTQTLMHLKSCL